MRKIMLFMVMFIFSFNLCYAMVTNMPSNWTSETGIVPTYLYHFDDGSSSNIEESVSGLNLSYTGSYDWNSTVNMAGTYSLEMSEESDTYGDTSVENKLSGSVTFSMWWYTKTGADDYWFIVIKDAAAGIPDEAKFGCDYSPSAGNYIRCNIYEGADYSSGQSNIYNYLFSENSWYHLTFLFDPANDNCSMYVNATLEETWDCGTITEVGSCSDCWLRTGMWYPGAKVHAGGIDELVFFNGTLNDNDIYDIYTGGYTPLGPPIILSKNCTSCTSDSTPDTAPFETSDTTPTFSVTTNEYAECAIADEDLNYTSMIDADSARNCSPTGSTDHICTLLPDDALIINETGYVYIACRDFAGDENITSTSGSLEIDLISVETTGEDAVEAGIISSVIGGTAIIYTNQQVYLRDSSDNQVLGTFDKVAVYDTSSQRWAFNYVTKGVESFITGLFNITPIFYAEEYTDMTFQEVNDSVRALIDNTKT
ncbi:MAG: hypothetical protein KAK00_05930 [Nanoarchaeota archaeon]|nr:hypothetical protein [Nanoarchaeota archaeon]